MRGLSSPAGGLSSGIAEKPQNRRIFTVLCCSVKLKDSAVFSLLLCWIAAEVISNSAYSYLISFDTRIHFVRYTHAFRTI